MASSYLNRIKKLPMAATPLPSSLPIHGFVGLILLYVIIEWGRKIFNLLTSHFSLITTQESEMYQKLPCFREEEEEESVSRDDVEAVFAKLGIFSHTELEGDKLLQERLSSKEFCGIFGEEEELREDEVKAAFDVFDENRDGFIEEKDLQRVMCALGLKEGFELENCMNMIKRFDEDGDGKIDFSEFSALF